MAFDPTLCAGCPLEGLHRPVAGEGPEDARFLVVTDVPTRAAARDGRLMGNADKRIVGQAMAGLGLTREDFRFVPMARCAYDPNDHTTKQKSAIHKHCRVHLLNEVEAYPRDALIPLGAGPASAAIGKATKITHVRGMPQKVESIDAPIFPLMSPIVVRNHPENAPIFQADIDSFGRFLAAGGDMAQAVAQRKTGEYTIVKDLQFLLDRDPDAELVLAFDTENTGLRWYQAGVDVRSYNPAYHKGSPVFQPKFQILTMQFSIAEGESFILPWDHPDDPIPEADKPRLRNQIRKLLCHPNRIVVGQRTKYDCVALWMAEGIRFRIGGDTNMLLALLDENLLEKNLDIAVKLFVPAMAGYADYFSRTVDKSRIWEVPLTDLAQYGGGDSDATLRLYNVLEPQVMADQKLWAHYTRISIPGLNALAGLETEGMFTDVQQALPAFRATMEREVEEARAGLLADLPRALKRAIVEDFRNKPDPKTGKPPAKRQLTPPEEILSFTRTDFLREILFTHPLGFRLKAKVFTKSTKDLNDRKAQLPSTSSKDHLPYFFDEEPYTFRLAEYVKDARMLGTSVIKFEENYIVGGKVRPTYQLADTVTGRVNSQDPNGQNYPKRGTRAKTYRKMFTPPPPGWCLYDTPYKFLADSQPPQDDDEWIVIEIDYSQAEVRLAASYANERTMLEIYRNKGDIHTVTAKMVMGVNDTQWEALPKTERKAARQKAKACIAEGQLVLTRDRGLVPIENITTKDLVWDGIAWVAHEGVIYQGYREVITYDGVTTTPDHEVYLEADAAGRYSHKVPLGHVASALGGRRLAVGAVGTTPVGYANPHGLDEVGCAIEAVRPGYVHALQTIAMGSRGQLESGTYDQLQMPAGGEERLESVRALCGPCSDQVGGQVRRDQAAHRQPEVPRVPGLWRARDQEPVREPGSLHPLHDGDLPGRDLRERGDRPQEQQWPLCAGQRASGEQGAESAEHPAVALRRAPAQEDPAVRPARLHPVAASDLPLQERVDTRAPAARHVSGPNHSEGDKQYAHVFDLVNAGPRHRFTVSGKVVSQCVFGFLYGMGWRKFIGFAKTQYGVEFTEAEAQQVRENFFRKYNRLPQWHKAMRDFARKYKYVRSYTGRIRHLPMIDSAEEYIQQEAERQAINSVVQETGSGFGVAAMGRMVDEVDPRYLRPVGFIHDAIVAYVRKKHLDWGLRTVKGYMESNPIQEWFGVTIKAPIVADASFGPNLGEVYECEGFELDQPFDYDAVLRDETTGELRMILPEQVIPPNNGRLTRPAFTLDTDLEPEDVTVVERKHRIIRAKVTEATIKRVERSQAQMVRNRRLRAARQEEAKTVRRILRSTLPATPAPPAPRAPTRRIIRK